jgi:hypothetical protein
MFDELFERSGESSSSLGPRGYKLGAAVDVMFGLVHE